MSLMSVWKTPIQPVGDFDVPFTVDLPRGAEPLTLQVQNGVPTIWWRVCKAEPMEKRALRIIGTGWTFYSQEVGRYLGTWQEAGFVWHVFESTR